MKKIFVLAICLILMSSTCEKDNSHFYIKIQNQSDKDIDMCYKSYIPFEDSCALIREAVIKKNSVFEYCPYNISIEKVLGRGSSTVLELYFVNNRQAQGFYDCDSIFIKNDILKHYRLTLEDLRQNDFTITYP